MTLAAFVLAYLGRPLDLDHRFGPQCMDLAEEYVAQVLHAPPLTGNAIDVWRHGARPGYTLVANGPTNAPLPGDLVVWGGPDAAVGTTEFGHIAVALLADSMGFLSFDQNWPERSTCHVQPHRYTGVLGWLRPLRLQSVNVAALM